MRKEEQMAIVFCAVFKAMFMKVNFGKLAHLS